MIEKLEEMIADRAAEMATHDGAPSATFAHIHGAANQIVEALLHARDRLIGGRGAHAQPEPEPAPEPEPEPEPAAKAEPAPEPEPEPEPEAKAPKGKGA